MSHMILLDARRPATFPKMVVSVFACIWLWHERARQRAQLARLDDRLLHDIGVTRDEAEEECAKPFWR